MAYRDEYELCPRCGIALVDAVVGTACSGCQGLWMSVASVAVMAAQMQTPPSPTPLYMQDDRRATLPCPSCRDPMATRKLYGVEIDLCDKHGIWFDARELATVLFRAARRPTS